MGLTGRLIELRAVALIIGYSFPFTFLEQAKYKVCLCVTGEVPKAARLTGTPALLLGTRFTACKAWGLPLSVPSSLSTQGCLPCPLVRPQSLSGLPTSRPMAIATVFSRSVQ